MGQRLLQPMLVHGQSVVRVEEYRIVKLVLAA